MLSVQSCTIVGFYNCVLGGVNSIVNIDRSSILQARGGAVFMLNPKVLKITGSRVEKANGHGVEVRWLKKSNHRDFMRKVMLKGSRVLENRYCGLQVSSEGTMPGEVPQHFVALKLLHMKMQNNGEDAVRLKNLSAESFEVQQCDLSLNNGCSVYLRNLRNNKGN